MGDVLKPQFGRAEPLDMPVDHTAEVSKVQPNVPDHIYVAAIHIHVAEMTQRRLERDREHGHGDLNATQSSYDEHLEARDLVLDSLSDEELRIAQVVADRMMESGADILSTDDDPHPSAA